MPGLFKSGHISIFNLQMKCMYVHMYVQNMHIHNVGTYVNIHSCIYNTSSYCSKIFTILVYTLDDVINFSSIVSN